MRTLLIALWLAGPSLAQEAAVDLSGLWKWHEGDDARFALPDHDDASWSARPLPRRTIELGRSWYRRRAIAPMKPGEYSLALGAFSHCFEVFLNGVKLGGTDCQPAADPPFPLAQQYRIPVGLLVPGREFVVALRTEGRRPSWIAAARLPDRGPYLVAEPSQAALHVELARLQNERAAAPFSWFAAYYLGAAILMFGLWTTNRDRQEVPWFGLFALLLGLFWFSLANITYTGEYGLPGASWFLPAANVFAGYAAYTVLHGRNIRPALAAALAAVVAASVVLLPRPFFQLVAAGPPTWWAVTRFRKGPAVHRAFASAVIAYAASNFNSFANQIWPASWPVPGGFYLGPFLISVTPLLSALVIAVMLLLVLVRISNEGRERQRLSIELESARTVQRLLLPPLREQGSFTVEAAFEPAREVGGDFYQIANLPDGGCLVAVGDVSGKGLEAAMVASVAVGAFRSAATDSPAAILGIMNRALAGQGRQGFVTCVCARFDGDGRIVAANAGHPAPYVDGRELAVEAGLPLGIIAGAGYEETAGQGNTITLVSDGVVEAENAQGELFGFDRTREISAKSAQAIADAANAWGQNDDITVVTVRRSA